MGRVICLARHRMLAVGLVLAGFVASVGAQALELRIVSPTPGETIHDNAGTVPVVVAGAPPGQALRVVLDGVTSAGLHTAPAFELHAVARGAHQLVVEMLGASGEPIGRSPSVRFVVWQASRLNPPP